MDKVVHFELPLDDTARGRKFYEEAFGWQTEEWPEFNYIGARSTPIDEKTQLPIEPGAINGGMFKRDPAMPHPMVYMQVKDIEASLKKIESAGGSLVRGKTAVGQMGFIANFKDSEGNILGLWQNV